MCRVLRRCLQLGNEICWLHSEGSCFKHLVIYEASLETIFIITLWLSSLKTALTALAVIKAIFNYQNFIKNPFNRQNVIKLFFKELWA